MSKKDQKKDNVSFKNDPFKAVKGFSVAAQSSEQNLPKKVPAKKLPTQTRDDSEVDFSQAMAQIGVEAIDSDDEIIPPVAIDEDDASNAQVTTTPVQPDDSDEALFLASLGQLDTVFTDNYAGEDEVPNQVAGARRMKQLRQGKLKPQDTLDLHGSYRDEALKRVRHFLQHRHADGYNTLLIVTGRGKRSPNGEAVLRSDVEEYLRTRASAWVAEWGRAPRQYGGEGALVVFLRQGKSV